jgi:hypothetical protein
MTPGLEFGEDQLVIYTNFVPATTGWNQGDAFDLWFEIRKQIVCQAHGLGSVVSGGAINDLDLYHKSISFS